MNGQYPKETNQHREPQRALDPSLDSLQWSQSTRLLGKQVRIESFFVGRVWAQSFLLGLLETDLNLFCGDKGYRTWPFIHAPWMECGGFISKVGFEVWVLRSRGREPHIQCWTNKDPRLERKSHLGLVAEGWVETGWQQITSHLWGGQQWVGLPPGMVPSPKLASQGPEQGLQI